MADQLPSTPKGILALAIAVQRCGDSGQGDGGGNAGGSGGNVTTVKKKLST